MSNNNLKLFSVREARFLKTERMILKIVHTLHKHYNYVCELEDLIQQAYLFYFEAELTYQPELGAFTTHIYDQVSGRLQWYIERDIKRSTFEAQNAYNYECILQRTTGADNDSDESHFYDVLDKKAEQAYTRKLLSNDSELVLDFLERGAISNDKRKRIGFNTIKVFLRSIGWSIDRIVNAVNELKEVYEIA